MQVCDTVDNVNPEAFLQMSQAAAYALEVTKSIQNHNIFAPMGEVGDN